MLIKLKARILINGLFPMKNYKIDEFKQKREKYDESKINTKDEDYIFYLGGHLTNSIYAAKELVGCFYEYFENDEYIEINVSNNTYNNKEKLQNHVLKYMDQKVSNLEKRLRLITNICVGLPIATTKIYSQDDKLITMVGSISGKTSNLSISEYTAEMKEILTQRLKFNITAETLGELEEKNSRYKRAFNFYNESFFINDIGVRFTLLFSSLEALFNLTGKQVKETIAKYTSKMLFLAIEEEIKYKKILRDYYKIRSCYIHGNKPILISDEAEFNLREIVRRVLLIYWCISQNIEIKKPEDFLDYLNKNNKDTIDLQLQLFIKMLDIKDYDDFYKSVRKDLLAGKTNIM